MQAASHGAVHAGLRPAHGCRGSGKMNLNLSLPMTIMFRIRNGLPEK
jgi:hypothetical protein